MVEEVVALLRKLLAELPLNVASLEVRHIPDGIVATLKPTNTAAASISLHAENRLELIDLSFGQYGPTWELPIEGYNPKANKQELLQEVEAICRAVMTGNCEHSRGLLSIRGTIQVGSRLYRLRDMLVFRVTPSFRGTRKYEPYSPGLGPG